MGQMKRKRVFYLFTFGKELTKIVSPDLDFFLAEDNAFKAFTEFIVCFLLIWQNFLSCMTTFDWQIYIRTFA